MTRIASLRLGASLFVVAISLTACSGCNVPASHRQAPNESNSPPDPTLPAGASASAAARDGGAAGADAARADAARDVAVAPTVTDLPPKPKEVVAFEECATRVMREGRGVGAVVRECQAELDVYTATVDTTRGDAIRIRPVAERRESVATGDAR